MPTPINTQVTTQVSTLNPPATPHITQAKHIHFTGIKGVGMTAAALCIQDLNIEISGSDTQDDFVTKDVLKQRQIISSIGFSPANVPPNTDLLIYTGAHQGQNNPEVVSARQKGIRIISHAQALGELMQGRIGISVCGVGGKTSICAMLANIFDYLGQKPSFAIGVGKVLNLQVPGKINQGKHFIAEADEYVVSPGTDHTPRFMYQNPQVIVCTNIVHDHPDEYTDISATKKAFQDFFNKLPSDGLLVINGNSGIIRELDLSGKNVVYYGQTPKNNHWWLKESFMGQGKQLATFQNRDSEFNLTLNVPGDFNAKNALAAYIVARYFGMEHQGIVQALQLYRGSMRRFEKVGEKDQIIYYDDYAHHPSQILATLKAAREWLPLNRLIVVFQPHTYSRTRVLLDGFAKSFSHADEVIITDIYASSREQPDPEISGYKLAQAISTHQKNVNYVPYNELIPHIKEMLKPQDVVFTLGAGDIYQIHQKLLQ